MSDKPLYVAFVWHMHQPLYKTAAEDTYLLPWVRLHGVKDYYDMAAILEKYPNIRQTFNLTPVLLMQLEDYVNNNASDVFLEMTLKRAERLNGDEKNFILYNFFMVDWNHMLKRFPRYVQLLEKRGRHTTFLQVDRIKDDFSPQEYLDLQVLFNLSWFDPMFFEKPAMKALADKGRDFTEDEKVLVIQWQKRVLSGIIDKYRKLQDSGQIEITTSPFYHPILPLIYNTDIGRIPSPRISMPRKKFSAREDIEKQIDRAVEFHKQCFGRSPEGMWPPEGAVCKEILPAIKKAGIKWIAADEGILENSLGKPIIRDRHGNVKNPDILYRPYKTGSGANTVNIIFRDHNLSDLLGFAYSKWKTQQAIDDFIKRLDVIREKTAPLAEDCLVSIILDGENAWEQYPNDGRDFLQGIYSRLNIHNNIKCVTVSEFFKNREARDTLPRLAPGSWINKNFEIWIGGEEENLAWDYLTNARDALVKYESGLGRDIPADKADVLSRAWEEIYAAEGSDWNWWYGDEHTSGYDDKFDILFRQHLANVYKIIGMQRPIYLGEPITFTSGAKSAATVPVDLISPVMDGKVTDYYEWLSSGHYEIRKTGGTMHQAQSIVKSMHYGFDIENLYLRLDLNIKLSNKEEAGQLQFLVEFAVPRPAIARFSLCDKSLSVAAGQEGEKQIGEIACDKIIEIKIPLGQLSLKPGEEIKFSIAVLKNDMEMEHWPSRAPVSIALPSPDFKLKNWGV